MILHTFRSGRLIDGISFGHLRDELPAMPSLGISVYPKNPCEVEQGMAYEGKLVSNRFNRHFMAAPEYPDDRIALRVVIPTTEEVFMWGKPNPFWESASRREVITVAKHLGKRDMSGLVVMSPGDSLDVQGKWRVAHTGGYPSVVEIG